MGSQSMTAWAQEDSLSNPMDAIEYSLVTCAPHEEIYSLYGHTALRYHNLRTKDDLVFNWGVFNYKKPYFALRFMFGLNDYELGWYPYQAFCQGYRRWGSKVTEQVLDLSPEEKYELGRALEENMQPQNIVYRYNVFYDNCSTRPRNIIERCLNGKLQYTEREDYRPTFRDMVHHCTRNHEWMTFGIDLLLGVKADLATTRSEQEFLPDNLMSDFGLAQIRQEDGSLRPLVKEERTAVEPGMQTIEPDFPLSPTTCALILLAVSLVIAGVEWKTKKTYKWWDMAWMVITSIPGIVILALFFSEHPTTSTNLQLLLLNPLPLFFIPAVVKGRKTIWWKLLLGLTVLFLIGGIWQDYAEGMEIVALCLLTRYWIHRKDAK